MEIKDDDPSYLLYQKFMNEFFEEESLTNEENTFEKKCSGDISKWLSSVENSQFKNC